MAVRKVMFMNSDGGALFIGDAIEHEGKLWLVPEWLEGPTKGTECPNANSMLGRDASK